MYIGAENDNNSNIDNEKAEMDNNSTFPCRYFEYTFVAKEYSFLRIFLNNCSFTFFFFLRKKNNQFF